MISFDEFIWDLIDERVKEQGLPSDEYLLKAKLYVDNLFPKRRDRAVFLMSMLETLWEQSGISFEDAMEEWRKARCWK